jgi:cell division protein FtsI/penicillin-binding protein 2/cell division protein FtsW (lipid II flippase)
VRGRLADLLAVAAALALCWLGTQSLSAIGETEQARRQLVSVAVGVAVLLVLRSVRSLRLRRAVTWTTYTASVVLLVAVDAAGLSANGAQRWLEVGGLTFQPSELAKLGLLLALADVLGSGLGPGRRLALALALAVPPIALVAIQPDLSTATLLALMTAALLVLARLPLGLLVPLFSAALLAAPLTIGLLRPYQLERVQAFTTGSTSAQGPGWATLQAHVAIGQGGLFGMSDQPLHRLAAQYLPGRETDFALASLVQQRGLVAGGLAVLAAAVIVWRCAAASRLRGEPRAALVAGGFAVLVGTETVVSVGGNLGELPVAGVPFPILSYGGSAAVVHLAALGIVLGGRRALVRHRLWLPPRWATRRPRLLVPATLALSAALVALSLQGVELQTDRGPALREVGQQQMTRCFRLPAPRGAITDRHGTPLAVDDTSAAVVDAVPGVLLGSPTALDHVGRLLGVPVPQLQQALGQPARLEVTVRLGEVPAAVGAELAAEPGVVVSSSPRRRYLYGPLLAPMLGFVGVATPADVDRAGRLPPGAQVGRAGIERQYDAVLRGVDGRQCVYVDPHGTAVAVGRRQEPVPGATLRLSIDLGLQQALDAALSAGLAAGPGRDLGGAVALDPRTGQVLAMASRPSFDNNLYGPPVDAAALARASSGAGDPMLEHVTQAAAPPGSTFKLVVAAANTAHPVLDPRLRVPTGGSFTYGGHTFGNWRVFGRSDLTQAIAWSNDVYFYKLALALGADAIHDTGTRLGVGRRTGIDLPGENPGFLGHPDNIASIGEHWYGGSTVLLGIGQGYVSVTPLQAAMWTAGVATGTSVVPRLGLAVQDAAGLTALPAPAPTPLPFAGALGPVRDGMRAAVTGGTAGQLADVPTDVGAKTGSAEDSLSASGETSSWFTAAAPLHDPQVVITSFVRGGGHGSDTSGPVVEQALRYFLAHSGEVLAGP